MEAKIAADGDEQNRREEREDKLTYNLEMDFGRLSVRELQTGLKTFF